MPLPRCLWCTNPPLEDVAVLRWQGAAAASDAENKERLTVAVCRRHLEGLRKAGDRGQDYKGWRYKLGWW